MVMIQKLASSSTAAILGAMKTRLWRLQNAEFADNLYDYDEEVIDDYSDFDTNDFSVDMQNGFANEEEKLQELINEAQYPLSTAFPHQQKHQRLSTAILFGNGHSFPYVG